MHPSQDPYPPNTPRHLPPYPVQPHYSDQSVYVLLDSPAQQSLMNQCKNQSSSNLLSVQPGIPNHSFSVSQPASLSDIMTDSAKGISPDTPDPKRACLSSQSNSITEIHQPEPCM